MTNYTTNCNLFITDAQKAQELYDYLLIVYPNNIDPRRGTMYNNPFYDVNGNAYTIVSFWATFANQQQRDEIWNTIKTYKQYCWLEGDNVEAQIIQKFDTGSPTFGSPLYNIVFDRWGMDC